MATFDYPNHTIEAIYPNLGYGVKFGNSYEFRAAPSAPDQVSYVLTLSGMRYESNGTDRTTNPQTNILHLLDFYNTHKLHTSFTYIHPTEGTLTVRFEKPIVIPAAYKGGSGVIPEMQIRLITQP